jgi:hypothetical protein
MEWGGKLDLLGAGVDSRVSLEDCSKKVPQVGALYDDGVQVVREIIWHVSCQEGVLVSNFAGLIIVTKIARAIQSSEDIAAFGSEEFQCHVRHLAATIWCIQRLSRCSSILGWCEKDVIEKPEAAGATGPGYGKYSKSNRIMRSLGFYRMPQSEAWTINGAYLASSETTSKSDIHRAQDLIGPSRSFFF